MTKLAIIREGKIPVDRRVPFTPAQAREIIETFPNVKVVCQESKIRCFKDEEYTAQGIDVIPNVHDADIFMGIKEVPIQDLIEGKTYLFFSHTIKKQAYNKKLLQTILQKKITLIDYEAIKDPNGNRLVAFGRYAGIVGAYNGLWIYGKRYGLYNIRRAHECFDLADLQTEFKKIKLPPVKILLTGGGRVGSGAMETLSQAGIRKVNPDEFLSKEFSEPVYTQINSADYHVRKDGGPFNRDEFHRHPQQYKSDFLKYAYVTDVLIAGAYWNPNAPALFNKEDMSDARIKIKVVADITCDIQGSIPCTVKSSTVDDPVYDYNPVSGNVEPPLSGERNITVMAIDNLPCELPRSASHDFGRDLIDRVLPLLFTEDKENIIANSTVTRDGKLTGPFSYLTDYVA